MAVPFTARVPKKVTKTVTFDGGSGSGAVGTVAIFTVTGGVWLQHMSVRCTTDLAGATATVEMGVSGNTASLVAQTTATDIDDGDWWHDATPEVGVSAPLADKSLEGNVIITVATAAVSAGVLEIVAYYLPTSADGKMT